LLSQLVLYLAAHPGNEPAMGTAVLIDYYGFTDEEKIDALAPHFDSADPRLRDAIWEVLLTVDTPAGARSSVELVRQVEQALDGGAKAVATGDVLATLARDESWWIRLYVAHVARRRPELVRPEVLARLREDEDPRVRRAADGGSSAEGR
ncbi:MAG TPA: hypothetical protein VD788_06390, partial [Candidatus Polarisedimenticolaceae bacterium]|nr:hypothetical protein [Candidatus Polarisedimenticolaceae bacterium]